MSANSPHYSQIILLLFNLFLFFLIKVEEEFIIFQELDEGSRSLDSCLGYGDGRCLYLLIEGSMEEAACSGCEKAANEFSVLLTLLKCAIRREKRIEEPWVFKEFRVVGRNECQDQLSILDSGHLLLLCLRVICACQELVLDLTVEDDFCSFWHLETIGKELPCGVDHLLLEE